MKLLREVNHRLKSTLPEAYIEIVSLPGLPSLRLGLINSDFPTGPLDADTMKAVIRKPAYWAFCWGSGLATASYILSNPNLVLDTESNSIEDTIKILEDFILKEFGIHRNNC